MDSKVVAPITKLKVRNAWGLQSETESTSPPPTPYGCEKGVAVVSEGDGRKNGGPNVVGGGKCRCCPYGYHIDLDFVRYCESLASGDYLRQLKQLHRSRRRQRKSIEALLGSHEDFRRKRGVVLDADGAVSSICGPSSHPPPPDLVSTGDVLRDALGDAMSDFEEAFKKSNVSCSDGRHGGREGRKPPNHLDLAPMDLLTNAHNLSVSSSSEGSNSDAASPNFPPYSLLCSTDGLLPLSARCRSDSIGSLSTISTSTTATETPSCCSTVAPPSKHMADTMETLANASMAIGSSSSTLFCDGDPSTSIDRSLSPAMVGISPVVLQSIRDQMAVSLHRMKELEEHAKAVPVLQVKLSVLKEEKRLLMLQLKANGGKVHQRHENGHTIPSLVATPSNRGSEVASEDCGLQDLDSLPRRTRTMAVSCSVLTREVGVGNIPASVRSVGVDDADRSKSPSTPFVCLECQTRDLARSATATRAVNTEPRYVSKESCTQVNFLPVVSTTCRTCQQNRLRVYCAASVGTDDNLTDWRSVAQFHASANMTSKSTSTVSLVGLSHTTGVQARPSCRDAQLQASLDVTPPKPQTRDRRVGCYVDVRHVGVSAADVRLVIARKDCGVGDASVYNLSCDDCVRRKSDQRTVGVGPRGIQDLLSNRRSGLHTCSVGVGTDSRGVRPHTRSVASGLCTVGDLLCDRCSRICTTSVGTITDRSADASPPSQAVNICDKCSTDITSAAEDLLGRSEHSDESVLSPIIEVSARQEASKGSGQEFRKRRLPMEFYINRCHSEAKDVEEGGQKKRTGGEGVRKRESGSDSSDSSDNESSSDSPDEGSYYSLRGVVVNTCKDDEAIRQGRPGAVMFQPIRESRKSHEFGTELREACGVVDDHLKKPQETRSKEVNLSLNVIRQEWFRVFSQKNTDQHAVEDHLDALESISHILLAKVVNLTDASGNTAMHYAISYANFDVVSLLLDSKVCNINKRNKAGYTCLMLASLATVKEESYLSVLKQLFKLGDVNMKASQHGQTALMLAASHGKVEMVRLLLEAGADINIQDDDGSTALMCASEHGHLGVVRCLLSNVDCDPNVADKDGSTGLSIAMEAGHKDVGLMIYAATSLSRGSSPYASLRLKRRGSTPTRSTSTPPPHTPPPPSPAWSRKSTSSVP